MRLDLLVSQRFGLSRRAAQEAVLTGRVDLDGNRCDEPGRDVQASQAVQFDPNRPKSRRVRTNLRVLHEDPHLIVVDKPAGLLTLPTALHEPDTLLSRVRAYLTIRHGGKPYLGIVHRLDQGTTGALVLARSPEALAALQAIFRSHEVERRYLAVVEGVLRPEKGTIDLPVSNDRDQLRRRVARPDEPGRHAVTHYQVLEQLRTKAAVTACWLETGRTHQVRLHLAAIGHPVIGDKLYRTRRRSNARPLFPRQALHAQVLAFVHPITGGPVHAEAPVPQDLKRLIGRLR
jgi:23S rRNA pseudouridine1911/1915/1917 synthase